MSFTDKEIDSRLGLLISGTVLRHTVKGRSLNVGDLAEELCESVSAYIKQHDQRLIEEIEREVKNMEGVDGSELIVRDKILFKLAEYKV